MLGLNIKPKLIININIPKIVLINPLVVLYSTSLTPFANKKIASNKTDNPRISDAAITPSIGNAMIRIPKIIAIMLLMAMLLTCGCGTKKQPEQGLGTLKKVNSMELSYANMFSVDYYEGGYKLITIANEDQYIVVPKDAKVPEGLPKDIVVLKQPIENIYLAASASMCLFDALNRLDAIKLSGTQASGWYIDNAKKAMEEGKLEPDFMPHSETIRMMGWMDAIRNHVGIVYPFETEADINHNTETIFGKGAHFVD